MSLKELFGINQMKNCEDVCFHLAKAFNVSITRCTLIDIVTNDPFYPSFRAISNLMNKIGLANQSLKIKSVDSFQDMPTPFLVQIRKNKTPLFGIIYQIIDNTVIWYNPIIQQKKKISKEDFQNLFTGYIQIYSKEFEYYQNDFFKKKLEDIIEDLIHFLLMWLVPILILLLSVYLFGERGYLAIFPVSFCILSLIGTFLALLIIFQELGTFNSYIDKLCSFSPKTNCQIVLESRASKILGIPWSNIGFSYFLSVLLMQLLFGIDNTQVLCLIAWVNVIVLPYVFYSIYYQLFVIKHWCILCLSILSVLISQFIVSLKGNLLGAYYDIKWQEILSLFVILSLTFCITYYLIPLIENEKHIKNLKRITNSIKYNKDVFYTIIKQNKPIKIDNEIGIIIGNPNASIRITTVCSAYCGACQKAHVNLSKIVENNPRICLHIIFTASDSEDDFRNKPVKLFLASYYSHDENKVIEILDDWFKEDNKQYEGFSQKFHFEKSILNAQKQHLTAMYNWCVQNNILYTPTIFINGYLLPQFYSSEDLQYLL